jgi:hypothetical protein
MNYATVVKDIPVSSAPHQHRVALRAGPPVGSGNSRTVEMTPAEAVDLAIELLSAQSEK